MHTQKQKVTQRTWFLWLNLEQALNIIMVNSLNKVLENRPVIFACNQSLKEVVARSTHCEIIISHSAIIQHSFNKQTPLGHSRGIYPHSAAGRK